MGWFFEMTKKDPHVIEQPKKFSLIVESCICIEPDVELIVWKCLVHDYFAIGDPKLVAITFAFRREMSTVLISGYRVCYP